MHRTTFLMLILHACKVQSHEPTHGREQAEEEEEEEKNKQKQEK